MAALSLLLLLAQAPGSGDAGPDFAREVRPVLAANCFPCHGPDPASRQAGLRLDLREEAVRDRGGWAAVVPGDPEASEILFRVTDPEEPMPPAETGRRLEAEEVEILRRWIEAGAPYTPHRLFQKPERPPLPAVRNRDWPRNEVDVFLLARMEEAGLEPSPEADRWTLARRLSLALTGLPPDPERARAFVSDPRPDAWERYVEELLASPAHAEQMAARWLDLARYADSAGYGSDPLRTIWRYRDWVIEAFQENLPYDRFTLEQIAGDLLPDATVRTRLATAFHRNTMTNTEGGTDDEEFRVAAVKDRASVTAQVWMGLTLSCAECHSHKFDPISQEEYYRFFAFFNQTADADRNDEAPVLEEPLPGQEERLAALKRRVERLRAERDRPREGFEEALAAWARAEQERQAAWRPVRVLEARSRSGTPLETHPGGEVRAGGEAAERDLYELLLDPGAAPVTALRLEALASPELPGQGPGRSPGNGNFVLTEIEVLPEEPAGPERGRYVRVEHQGEGAILSLAEVEVLGGGRNLALGAPARQSSTAYEGEAARAVDGDRNGHYFEGRSVTHTATEDRPWWEVDLGGLREIEAVRVWNRTDGGLEERLSDFAVVVLDEAREAVARVRVRTAPRPSREIRLDDRALERGRPTADFSQEDWPAAEAADGDLGPGSGWAVAPRQGRDHALVLPLKAPAPPGALRLRLHQEFGGAHVLGRFRVLATGLDPPPAALPAGVARALGRSPEERTPEEREALRRHFRTVDPETRALEEGLRAAEEELAAVPVVKTPVLVELPPEKRRRSFVLEKGNFLQPRQEVEPGTPAFLHPWPEGEPRNRLGLARWLVHPDNPLTARVHVNRLWALVFGRGLVETQEDFGTQGTPPSHPGLLDWLAVEFQESGWNPRHILRLLVQSAAFRQSSRVLPEHREKDPRNVLLARMSRVPLQAEEVRDAALHASGLLSRKLGGPSVYPPQPVGLWKAAFNGQRTWPTSTGEDRYRRGLYVFLRRTIPYPSLQAFDMPSREVCTFRRVRTNTPLQAFTTLNDPAFVECARMLARRILEETAGAGAEERAAHGLFLCLQRPPEPARVRALAGLVEEVLAWYREHPGEARRLAADELHPLPEGLDAAEAAAWTVAANVLLNQDAFLTRP